MKSIRRKFVPREKNIKTESAIPYCLSVIQGVNITFLFIFTALHKESMALTFLAISVIIAFLMLTDLMLMD